MLVQSAFETSADWKRISDEIQATLDVEDGGIDGMMLGLRWSESLRFQTTSSRTSSLAINRENDEHDPSHNVSYATKNGYEVPVS